MNEHSNNTCQDIQEEILELQWTQAQREQAQRLAEHLKTCPACRDLFEEADALRAALAPQHDSAQPRDGWDAFEQRLLQKVRRPAAFPWRRAVAAGLLIAFTAGNAWMFFRQESGVQPLPTPMPVAVAPPTIPTDIPAASVAEAFRKVSEVFDGKADWVMLSDQSSDVGLIKDPQTSRELLVLRLVVTHGNAPVSQMHIAVVPGATVRVTVPSVRGEQLQYVITTDAVNLQNVAVSLAVEDGAGSKTDTGLGSMATTLNMPYGKSTPTGRITTRDGTFDLSMTLERASRMGA